uniref:Transcription factor S-II (TFIIS), central domain containing protein, putative n=1 Tax=Theileria annulata TaxID=5874 RepID=A0A3B0MUA8_THEAN
MKTRGLKVTFNDEGRLTTFKPSDPFEYEKTKVRKVYGTKITQALLASLHDINSKIATSNTVNLDTPNLACVNSEHTDVQDDPKPQNLQTDKSHLIDENYVKIISDKICDSCYDMYSHCNRTFKRKIFEICSNIKRESNSELREKILTRKMSISQLLTTETVELAPEDVREKRRQDIEKHYIRNVIIKDSDTIIPNSQNFLPDESLSIDSSINKKPVSPVTSQRIEINSLSKLGTENADLSKDENPDLMASLNKISELYSMNKKTRIIEDDDIKLLIPPKSDFYKFENVYERISKRLNSLPTNLSRPFWDPFNTATKRVELLMERSSILKNSFQ